MIDNSFRALLPGYVGPLLRLYDRLGLSPDGVSLLGFLGAGLACALILADWPLAAIAAWWIGRLFDGTDGIYARETGRSSSFGAYLDIVLDMAAYSLVVLAFAQVHPALLDRWLLILFLYVLCIASALALGMQERVRDVEPRDDRGLRLGAGLAEGGETGIAYTLFLLFPAHLGWLTGIWIAVLALTVVARTLLARRTLDVR